MPTILRCDPKLFEKDLTSQVVIVTGANGSTGLETSRQLSKQGATVVLACRNEERGKAAAKDIGNGAIFVAPLDLSSLDSVRDFVKAFQDKYNRLDVLVNNAGIMACPYGKTKDGFEMQIGCNHLGHFLLMHLLTPLLIQTADMTNKPSRFVTLSSCAAALTTIRDAMPNVDFEDLNYETRKYDESDAYGQSKLSNYLHVIEAANRYPADKLISASVHPGWVQSNLDSHALAKIFGTGMIGSMTGAFFKKVFIWKGDIISPVDGAQSSLHCILADDIESGKFYSQFGIYKDEECKKGGWPMKLPNPNATPEVAAKLWDISEKLVGLK